MKDFVILSGLFLVTTLTSARIIPSPRQGKLSLAEPMPYYYHNDIDGYPGTYSYGYDVVDPATGNKQFRTEERYPNGTVIGSYGYVDSWGRPHHFRYVADERGYRVMKEPIYRPYIPPTTAPPSYPIYNYPTENSVTWTRPKKPYKKKHNYYNRPTFVGPPSSYAEDK